MHFVGLFGSYICDIFVCARLRVCVHVCFIIFSMGQARGVSSVLVNAFMTSASTSVRGQLRDYGCNTQRLSRGLYYKACVLYGVTGRQRCGSSSLSLNFSSFLFFSTCSFYFSPIFSSFLYRKLCGAPLSAKMSGGATYIDGHMLYVYTDKVFRWH